MIWVFNIGTTGTLQIQFPSLALNPANTGALLTENGLTLILF